MTHPWYYLNGRPSVPLNAVMACTSIITLSKGYSNFNHVCKAVDVVLICFICIKLISELWLHTNYSPSLFIWLISFPVWHLQFLRVIILICAPQGFDAPISRACFIWNEPLGWSPHMVLYFHVFVIQVESGIRRKSRIFCYMLSFLRVNFYFFEIVGGFMRIYVKSFLYFPILEKLKYSIMEFTRLLWGAYVV